MNKENQDFKQRIIKIWDKVAPEFSKVGPRYWDKFGKRLVELSDIKPMETVLDMGMGRGASLFPSIEKVGEKGKVIGIDLSENMVTETFNEINERNISNAEVRVMDVEKLDFEENSFDNVIGGFIFSYIFFSEEKFNGVLRILKEGGKIAFSTWGVQDDQRWLMELMNKYLRNNQNNEKEKDEKTKKESKIPKFDTKESVKDILVEAGFKDIQVYEEKNEVVYASKEEWWCEMYSNAARRVFEEIEKLGKDKLDAYKTEVFSGLKNYEHGNEIRVNMPVIYAFGRK